MKVDVFVFSKRVANWDESFNLSALFSIFKKTGFTLENLVIKDCYDFDLVEKSLKSDAVIVFCEKKDMEVFEINLSYRFSSERQVIFDECVWLNSGMNVVFVPLLKNYFDKDEDFLKQTNSAKQTSMFRLFGKSASSVKKALAENQISLENIDIIENNLLCDIYVHEDKGVFGISELQQQIGSLFMENIYSESDKTLKDTLVELLKINNYKITFIEPFTCGEISKMFCEEKDMGVVYEGIIPINERSLIQHSMMSGADYQSYGGCSVETNSFLANAAIAEKGSDIVAILTAKKVDDGYNMLMTLVSRQFKSTIKTTYKGKKQDCIDFASKWVLFNLVKKLRKKDFENM